MTAHGGGSFSFKDWNEHTINEPTGGAKLSQAAVTNLFHGTIEGEGTAQYLLAYTDKTTGTYTGLEQIVGRVDGRTGSFVLLHTGTFAGDSVVTTLEVVADSGSGELKGLRGTGGFTAKHGEAETSYTFAFD